MISSLPGKASRTLVESRGLPRYREYKGSIFDIKFTRQGFKNTCWIARLAETYRILGECLLISSLLGKALRMLVKVQGHDGLIKAYVVKYATFIRSTCSRAVYMKGN